MLDQREFIVKTLAELSRRIAENGQKPSNDTAFILDVVAECLRHRAEEPLIEHLITFMMMEGVLDGLVAPKPRDIQ